VPASNMARAHASFVLVLAPVLQRTAGIVLRYGLVVIILWFGAFKFTGAEAHAIQPLLSNSPVLGWLYSVTTERGASRVIGTAEILIAVLIALRPLAPRLSAIGSLAAIGMFVTTLSFLASTPGIWVQVEGFLIPNETGGFLLKDLFLLGAALWSASEALMASQTLRSRGPSTVTASA
jgi:reactive chlorine resistance protein C